MKESRAWQAFWVLLILSVLTKMVYEVWNSQRPTDEQVQQRMRDGMEAAHQLEQVREIEKKFKADHERAFGTHDKRLPRS